MGYKPSGIMLFDTKKITRIKKIESETGKGKTEYMNCPSCGAPRNLISKCEYCGRVFNNTDNRYLIYADCNVIGMGW